MVCQGLFGKPVQYSGVFEPYVRKQTPTWEMRNQMTWNLLIIVQIDKISWIFKFLSQEE